MTRHQMLAAAAALGALGSSVHAQSLADRVANASSARVQFTFAARADVCGNGRSFIQVARDSWYGSFNDGDHREACAAGPIRVLLDRAGHEIVSLSTFAGPVPASTDGVTNLGTVPARAAAEFLLGLAERGDGRVSRDAVFPAVLADSVDVSPRLLALARNRNAARETRRSAISWLGRSLDDRERAVKDVTDALVQIARDPDDNRAVRQQALRTLARLDHGAGTAALTELARDSQHQWLSREALTVLNATGDPRARHHLRDVVRRAELPDDVLVAAIRGLGGEYATGEDIGVLRATYSKLPGDRSREAAISAIATFGGSDNVRWLLALARNGDQPMNTRRRAIQHATRVGAPILEIVKIYDETTDKQMKEAVINALVESGERAATDKLMQIARTDEFPSMRLKAINALSRSPDERVKKFLSDLANR